MSFYRTLLAALAAAVIASPVFAEDLAANNATDQQNATTTTTETTTTSSTTEQTTKININTATAKDLVKVKGINAPKARAIIAYSKTNGDFKSLDDLSKVKGFKK